MSRPSASSLPSVRAWTVPAAAAVAIVAMLALILVVDVWGAFGGIDALHRRGLAPPAVWFQMFQDRGVAEFLQWMLYGWFIVLAATLRGRWADADSDTARAWLLLAVGGVMILAEDAGDVRDSFLHWGDVFLPGARSGLVAMALWFGSVAVVMALAVFRFGQRIVDDPAVRGYGIAGVSAFALASSGEVIQRFTGWMEPAGRWLAVDLLGSPDILQLPGEETSTLAYLFADFVVEEPLELLGGALLVAAALAHVRCLRRDAAADATSAAGERGAA